MGLFYIKINTTNVVFTRKLSEFNKSISISYLQEIEGVSIEKIIL
ncbi:hypothetical protein bthur0005_55660 [Bacillus thuringiensis serovar pakistani str. T13001]|nr:hypothetical protein bthur0005_55660 [Bacillus thuringiensis serovar pakistani str. T13001]